MLVELERGGRVTIHSNMPADERELVASLVLKGYVVLGARFENEGIERRDVVATPVARAMNRIEYWEAA